MKVSNSLLYRSLRIRGMQKKNISRVNNFIHFETMEIYSSDISELSVTPSI